jgi:hypothetical protein
LGYLNQLNHLNESELHINKQEKKKKIRNRIIIATFLIPAIIITYLRSELFLLVDPIEYESTLLYIAALLGAFLSSLFIPIAFAIIFFLVKRFVFNISRGTFILPFSIFLLIWSTFMLIVNFGKLISPYIPQ